MKILELVGENFKRIRVVEIKPDGHVVTITGRNGQGKTSVLDLIWFLLKGRKAQPVKTLRNGSEKMRGKIRVGDGDLEFWVTRTLGSNTAIPTLTIEMIKGQRDKTPQEFLDDIFGELTFDPLAFIHMDTKEQIAELRKTAKVNVDFEAIAEANAEDYKTRGAINKEVDQLRVRINSMETLEGLPAQKVDESAILAKLNNAGEANRKAQETWRAKQELGQTAARIGVEKIEKERQINNQRFVIQELQKQIDQANKTLTDMEQQLVVLEERRQEAEEWFQAAPSGESVDVSALTQELQNAQRTNRAIDARQQKEQLQKELAEKKRASENITRQMEAREEQKRAALAKAKIPVDGLMFDENAVTYNGLPLEQLGEGEQIRISTLIGMAANPRLRVLCIRHGEALDEDGMKVLAKMATEHDYQIWMSRVDSSGKTGIVLEDGMVVATHEEE